MQIIGFTGKKGTGKSTACSYLEEFYGFKRVNFKDALIKELKQYYGLLLEEICVSEGYVDENGFQVDKLFETKPPLVRKLMQSHGQMRREENPEYWVIQWKLAVVEAFANGFYKITTDDARYLNEAMAIKSWNGEVVQIVRTDMVHTDTHISETEMDMIEPDFQIVCVGGDHHHLHLNLDKIV